MKLTQTQTAILAEIEKRGFTIVTSAWGHGAKGGWRTYGARERNAAIKLVEAGLIKLVDAHTQTHYERGWAMHSTENRFEKTGA
jgi:hypothetical protein